jgi:hypothetical protein
MPPPPAPAPPALAALLKALAKPAPDEWPAEPELKADRQRQDADLLERQDLDAGAVLELPLEPDFGATTTGGGAAADDAAANDAARRPPEAGDVALVHLTVRAVGEADGGSLDATGGDDDYGPGSSARILFTTRADEEAAGGSGSSSSTTGGAPIAFRLGKGRTRPPRALELVLSRMRPGERRMVRAAHRAYGFAHPDCGLAGVLPLARGGGEGEEDEDEGDGAAAGTTPPDLVAFDVELLSVLPSRDRADDAEEDDDDKEGDDDDDETSSSSSSSSEDDERAAVARRLQRLQARQRRRQAKKEERDRLKAAEPLADASTASVRALVYARCEGGAAAGGEKKGGAVGAAADAAAPGPPPRQQQRQQQGQDELDDLFKRTLRDSDSWESARAPNEATFALALRPLAPDGAPMAAPPYFEAPADAPLSVPLGRGLLPRGVELALEHTTRGETALFLVPARLMAPPPPAGASADAASVVSIPPPPAGAYQVEARVELLRLVQVRDLTGDGGATKRRLCEGEGAFPADCPLHDTTVRVHWRARRLDPSAPPPPMPLASQVEEGGGEGEEEEEGLGEAGQEGEEEEGWRWPDEAPSDGGGGGAKWDYDSRADPRLSGKPLRVDTGCGDLPAALELAVRLMTPGEVACVRLSARYAQPAPATGDGAAAAALRAAAADDARRAREAAAAAAGRGQVADAAAASAPAGGAHAYEYHVRLVSFEREGYWQRLPWRARLALADRLKRKGNALCRAGRGAAAAGRYDHLLRLLASTRDFDAPEGEEGEEGEDEEEEDEDEERRRQRQQRERGVAEARAAAVDALRGAALANLAAAALAAGDGARALKACDAADEMEGAPGAPDPAKVAFRRARALAMMAEPERADAEFSRAAALLQARVDGGGGGEAGGDAAAAAALAEVRAAQRRARLEAKQHAAQQRAAMGNFFAREAGG